LGLTKKKVAFFSTTDFSKALFMLKHFHHTISGLSLARFVPGFPGMFFPLTILSRPSYISCDRI
jgi:hypothetical protein